MYVVIIIQVGGEECVSLSSLKGKWIGVGCEPGKLDELLA